MSSKLNPTRSSSCKHPEYLDPSELGTKNYWDSYYINEFKDAKIQPDPSTLSSWFSDVNAPRKILKFLLSTEFPLSPHYSKRKPKAEDHDRSTLDGPSVLDVGTGNGKMLFELRHGNTDDSDSDSDSSTESDAEEASGYRGPLYGIDYSARSIELARAVCAAGPAYNDIHFHVMDVLTETPESMSWWPCSHDGSTLKLFDLILDKGTFDAISLSSHPEPDSQAPHPSTIYPARVARLLNIGGFLLVTSCNWTKDELIEWFIPHLQNEIGDQASGPRTHHEIGPAPMLDVYDTIKYPTFEFGGREGAGMASLCFRRVK